MSGCFVCGGPVTNFDGVHTCDSDCLELQQIPPGDPA